MADVTTKAKPLKTPKQLELDELIIANILRRLAELEADVASLKGGTVR